MSRERLMALAALLPAAGVMPRPATTCASARLGFGIADLDARLGGGLAAAALHEIFAASAGDDAAASGFALLLALRCDRPGPLVWLREDRGERETGPLHGPGLAELGFDPDRLVLVRAPDTLAVLRAGGDAAACAAVSAVVIEPWGRAAALDLTVSRRLALAAARSGVPTLLLRAAGGAAPSAAHSRWQVASAGSAALPANAPGNPAFAIRLLRHRGGIAGFDAQLEWNRDRRAFAPLLSGAVPAAAAQPAAGTIRQRAA